MDVICYTVALMALAKEEVMMFCLPFALYGTARGVKKSFISARGSRFLKFENRYADLICGSNSKTNLQNTFFKIFSTFLRK
jgi:hypothetical protein